MSLGRDLFWRLWGREEMVWVFGWESHELSGRPCCCVHSEYAWGHFLEMIVLKCGVNARFDP